MKSAWNDRDAEAAVALYAAQGVNRDVALRVYTTRLLGRDPKLVLHGGGNTSVKTRMRDLLGAEVDVLCVKGSGWDMAKIEPPGLPAVRLDALRTLRGRAALSDYMGRFQVGVPGGRFHIRWVLNHHDRSLAHWSLHGSDGAIVQTGTSFGALSGDGRLQSITGFFHPAKEDLPA